MTTCIKPESTPSGSIQIECEIMFRGTQQFLYALASFDKGIKITRKSLVSVKPNTEHHTSKFKIGTNAETF